MADMAWVMPDMLDMLDLAMDIPMLLDITTLARGLLMLSPRPRLMLILLFYMVPMDMAWVMPDMLDMAMLPLTLMAMLATHMPGENKLFQCLLTKRLATENNFRSSCPSSQPVTIISVLPA